MANCIWCGVPNAASYEHILPEALGCPNGFVLTEGVCTRCNNSNSRVDRALLQPFEIITLVTGMKRKGGRPASVDGWPNFYARADHAGHPEIFMNGEKHAVELPCGSRKLQPTKGDSGVKFEHTPLGDGRVEFTVKQELRFPKNAVRGLFKVALEMTAFRYGLAKLDEPWAIPARRFVTAGVGSLTAYMTPDLSDQYSSLFGGIWDRPDRAYPITGFTILNLGFIVDFDPANAADHQLTSLAANENLPLHRLPNFPKTLARR